MTNRKMKWTIFGVTTAGNFASMMDFSSVNIALYKMADAFAMPVSTVQWVMLSFQIVMTSLLIFCGRLSDIVSRRKLYTAGFAVFAAGGYASYLAPDFVWLLCARVFQSVGGAILISNSFAVVSSVFEGRERGKALGFLGAVVHLAGMTAPVLGGWLIETFQWRAVFLPGAVVATLAVIPSGRLIPVAERKGSAFVDVSGTVLLFLSVSSLLLTVANGLSAAVVLVFAVSVVLFLIRESTARDPLMDLTLFRNKPFLFGNSALLVSYCAMYPNTILFPFYTQGALHLSAKTTGEMIFPFSLSYLITAINTGSFSPRKRMFFGMILLAAGLFGFSQSGLETSSIYLITMQIIMGIGNGLFQPSANTAIMNAVGTEQAGTAGGVLSLSRNTGIAVGSVLSVAMFEAVKNSAAAKTGVENAVLSAYHISLYAGMGFAALCLSFVWLSASRKGKVS